MKKNLLQKISLTALLIMAAIINGRAQTWAIMDSTFQQSLKDFDFYDDNTGIVSRGYVTNTTSNGAAFWGPDLITSSAIYSLKYTSASTVFRGQDNGTIWKSTNGGTTWSQIGGNILGDVRALDFNGSTGIATDNYNAIAWSNDGGSNWTKIPNTALGGGIGILNQIAIPSTSVAYVAGTASRFWKSTNAGQNWSQITSLSSTVVTNINGISFVDPLIGFVSCDLSTSSNNALYKTTDGGVTWTDISAGLPTQKSDVYAVNANKIYIGAGDNKIYKSIDGGITWSIDFTHPSLSQCNIKEFDKGSNSLFAIYDNGGTHKKIMKLANAFTGINETELQNSFSLSPNPSNGKFHIIGDREISSVEIYNMIGQKIIEEKNPTSFDLSNYAKGIYFVKIYSGNHNITKKIIVE